ncbi:MAG: type II toxin-antitoxin system HicB family antitoxin [Deltaproteobacteria bacterium]|nr:type II toxin-antitoxin system HicB family antitoxin [Deltaproteobacteria bacterium]
MKSVRYQANVWFLIERDEDVGEWVATCPDFYVVTQGRSLKHAFEMIQEAVFETVRDDLADDRDPMDRRAPKKIWDDLWSRLRHAEKRPPNEPFPKNDDEIDAVLLQATLTIPLDAKKRVKGSRSRHSSTDSFQLPLALAVYEHQA